MNRPKIPSTRVRIGRGALGGRYVTFTEAEDLRPTLGRVKDAVFSMLAELAADHGFLDLCAGTGVMGFEAFSMGFQPVWMFEPNRDIFNSLEKNRDALGANVTMFRESAFRVERLQPPAGAWVCYADPPFADTGFHKRVLEMLAGAAFFEPGSLYVAEREGGPLEAFDRWEIVKHKKYGRIHITILEKQPENDKT
ncbi:MAG: RsmD family RNA methyltransferase [Acidobacteriota bacterium]|nr:RsmD family RNA methyltransferase [Acidobacteriota bacterium]